MEVPVLQLGELRRDKRCREGSHPIRSMEDIHPGVRSSGESRDEATRLGVLKGLAEAVDDVA